MKIQLLEIEPKWKEEILAYKQEFLDNQDSMDGTAGLKDAATFEEWYQAVCDNKEEATVRDGLVPASTFLAVEPGSDRLVGMIDIRHRLNDHLLKFGGHIGYSVRIDDRRRGIASAMLREALEVCKKLGISRVLITCNEDNIASAKTILKQGGILENMVLDGDTMVQRYWISLGL